MANPSLGDLIHWLNTSDNPMERSHLLSQLWAYSPKLLQDDALIRRLQHLAKMGYGDERGLAFDLLSAISMQRYMETEERPDQAHSPEDVEARGTAITPEPGRDPFDVDLPDPDTVDALPQESDEGDGLAEDSIDELGMAISGVYQSPQRRGREELVWEEEEEIEDEEDAAAQRQVPEERPEEEARDELEKEVDEILLGEDEAPPSLAEAMDELLEGSLMAVDGPAEPSPAAPSPAPSAAPSAAPVPDEELLPQDERVDFHAEADAMLEHLDAIAAGDEAMSISSDEIDLGPPDEEELLPDEDFGEPLAEGGTMAEAGGGADDDAPAAEAFATPESPGESTPLEAIHREATPHDGLADVPAPETSPEATPRDGLAEVLADVPAPETSPEATPHDGLAEVLADVPAPETSPDGGLPPAPHDPGPPPRSGTPLVEFGRICEEDFEGWEHFDLPAKNALLKQAYVDVESLVSRLVTPGAGDLPGGAIDVLRRGTRAIEDPEGLAAHLENWTRHLVGLLDDEGVHKVRATFLPLLGKLGGPLAVAAIRQRFEDSDARVRANALEALFEHRISEPERDVFARLEDENERTRTNAIIVLCRQGLTNEVERQVKELSVDGYAWRRTAAIDILARHDAPWVPDQLVTICEKYPQSNPLVLPILEARLAAGKVPDAARRRVDAFVASASNAPGALENWMERVAHLRLGRQQLGALGLFLVGFAVLVILFWQVAGSVQSPRPGGASKAAPRNELPRQGTVNPPLEPDPVELPFEGNLDRRAWKALETLPDPAERARKRGLLLDPQRIGANFPDRSGRVR